MSELFVIYNKMNEQLWTQFHVWVVDVWDGMLEYDVLLLVFVGLDGSTSGQDREKLINQFNDPENFKIKLFMLSTR